MSITIEGRYADVLPAVRALSTLHVPASLALTSLTRANPENADPTVSATVHVDLGTGVPNANDANARPA